MYQVRQSVSSEPLPTPSTTTTIHVAEQAKPSPLPTLRRLLKRVSSLGHDIADNLSLPKRRRITGKAPPRIEFMTPRRAQVLESSSSATSRPTVFGPGHANPTGSPEIVLPEVEEKDIDLNAGIYAGM